MEEKVNLIKKIYDILENASKTRFGSAVIGFALASLIAWFLVLNHFQRIILATEQNNKRLWEQNNMLRDKMITIRDEEQEKAREEYQQNLTYIYGLVSDIQNDVKEVTKVKQQDIKRLESEIRKEGKK